MPNASVLTAANPSSSLSLAMVASVFASRRADKFHIPAGALTLSLDPAQTNGRFTRAGVSWFASELLAGSLPSTDDEVTDYLARLRKEADDFLESSPLLSEFDLEDEHDSQAAFELLMGKRETTEWWMLVMGSAAAWLLEDVPVDQRRDVLRHALRMQAARSVVVYRQSLEPHVWVGYQHNSLVYGIAAAAARDPADADKIQAVRPLLERLDEAVLNAFVQSGTEIGPRLGITGIDESLLKALAQFHLDQFERRRSDERFDRDHRTSVWANRVGWAAVGAAGMGAAATVVAALI